MEKKERWEIQENEWNIIEVIQKLWNKRKFIFKEDKMPKAIYLITEGEVTCYRGDNIVRKLTKGSIFGEIPLFTQTESMYGYCAEKDSELFRVKYELINVIA